MKPVIFSQEALKQVVDKAVAENAKPGDKGLLVGTVDNNGAQVVLTLELKNSWELQAAAGMKWTGEPEAGVKVLRRW